LKPPLYLYFGWAQLDIIQAEHKLGYFPQCIYKYLISDHKSMNYYE